MVKAVRDIITEYPRWIKTITSDNGSEFMNAAAIERLGIPIFMRIVIVHGNEEATRITIS
uniref:hypothetical protein n=1 Tax=Fusobacterium necrophorum TaxID=859 RepID=UPI000A97141D|nr:hypothetical protein [Fusobacterium necrophorum]